METQTSIEYSVDHKENNIPIYITNSNPINYQAFDASKMIKTDVDGVKVRNLMSFTHSI